MGDNPPRTLDFVQIAAGVVKTKAAAVGGLQVLLSDELAEVQQDLAVLLVQPQLLLQEGAASGLHHFQPLRGADGQVEVVGEGEQEGLGGEATERALDVKEVGGAAADEGAVVSHVGEQLAAVRRASQSPLVYVQDGDVAAVA